MTRVSLFASVAPIVLGTLLATPVAAREKARVAVLPYIELSQTADADLKSGGVLTYTSLAAGVDASVDTRRAQAQVSYRYEHRFGETDHLGDEDIHSGLARAAVLVVPGLTIEGGALATRARADIRGDAPGVLAGNDRANISKVYSLYAGPTVATHAGPVSLDAAYRIGYTKATAPRDFGLPNGQRPLGYFDSSTGQSAVAAAGISPRTVLPVGLTASAGWYQERAGQLKQHYDDYYARGDVLAPISPYVALAAGVGYEKLTSSQRDPLLAGTNDPLLDARGRYIVDPNGPRRITYRTDGVYYDAGIIWKPNRRTTVSGYAGKRYGTDSYTGSVSYQASRSVGVGVQVYDVVTTFGRQLRTGLGQLPTSFIATRDQFAQAFKGCTYGTAGAAPGGCLNGVFQSVTAASYRARGVDAVVSATRGLSTYGAGLGYANRKLFTPVSVTGATLYGLEDQSWYGDIFYNHQLSAVSGISTQAFVNYYDPAFANADDVVSIGGTASYYHDFGRLSTTAGLGLYWSRYGDGDQNSLAGQALLGARYTFGGIRR